MKKITYLFCILSISFMSAQDITFTFENAEITNDGMNDYYEVDIMGSSTADLLLGNGQFYINYDESVFGSLVIDNMTGEFENTGMLAPPFWSLVIADNTSSRVSFAFLQQAPPSAYGAAQTVNATPKVLTHLKLQYLAGQTASDPGICFESGDGFTDLNFTACGGVFGPDCFNSPGVQITDDTFDCSGAALPVSCATTTTYTIAGGWDNGLPTNGTAEAIIAESYDTVNGNIVACALTVNMGATLTVGAGEYISVVNDITVDGTLDVEHQGSVVQVEDGASVTNNGTINVNVTTPVLKPRDFMMIGSPMTGVTREGDLSSANLVMNHNTSLFVPNPDVAAAFPMAENFADDNFNDFALHTGVLNGGEGYLLRPRPITATGNESSDYTFSQGTLNNGVVNYGVTFQTDKNSSFNLLANPYASAIDADVLINGNAMIDEVFFWEHVQSPSATFPGANTVNYSMEDVSMYNLLGGVAAASDPSTTPNQYISSMQGFAIKASAAGTAEFNNAMRVVDNNNTLRSADVSADRIWLTVRNNAYGLTSTALVGFTGNATAGLDSGYDSNRLATIISLYSHLEDGSMELGIQGREAFAMNKTVPMGFTTSVAENTEYEILIADVQGANIENVRVYLVDTYLNITHELSESNYTFTTGNGVESNRFVLQFEDKSVLSTDDLVGFSVSLTPNPTNGLVSIVSTKILEGTISVVDINNRVVYTQNNVAGRSLQLDLTNMSSGVYFVQITTANETLIKRILKE